MSASQSPHARLIRPALRISASLSCLARRIPGRTMIGNRSSSRATLRLLPRHGDITVVIPCFNHGRFLLESVDRALEQDGGPPKVIVVDDGSTDPETESALDSLPAGVQLIRQRNAGVAAARNAGFENSESELLL